MCVCWLQCEHPVCVLFCVSWLKCEVPVCVLCFVVCVLAAVWRASMCVWHVEGNKKSLTWRLEPYDLFRGSGLRRKGYIPNKHWNWWLLPQLHAHHTELNPAGPGVYACVCVFVRVCMSESDRERGYVEQALTVSLQNYTFIHVLQTSNFEVKGYV